MNARCFFVAAATILLSADRLPAPIVEEATAKPKRSHPVESQSKSQRRERAPTPTPAPVRKFAGKWSGIMPEVPWGNVQTELIVDPTETTIEWQDSLSSKHGTAKATLTGDTLSALFPGWPRPVWSITPDPGGNTARVRLQAFMNDDHAVFQRVSR